MQDHDSHDRNDYAAGELTMEAKFVKLADHWIAHNSDHAATYRKWAGTVREMGYPEAAERLEEAAELTRSINRKFEAAAQAVGSKRSG